MTYDKRAQEHVDHVNRGWMEIASEHCAAGNCINRTDCWQLHSENVYHTQQMMMEKTTTTDTISMHPQLIDGSAEGL